MQRVQAALDQTEGVDTYEVKVGSVTYTGEASAEAVIAALEKDSSYKATKK